MPPEPRTFDDCDVDELVAAITSAAAHWINEHPDGTWTTDLVAVDSYPEQADRFCA